MASIKDVAKHAGVAISTVSKVLNNYPNISEETRQKVNASIQELGFVPNAVAAALSSKHAGRIALLINLTDTAQTADEISLQYMLGALGKARELGLDVVTVFFSMLQGKTVDEMVNYFRSQSITGIIVCGLSKDDTTILKLVKKQIFKMVLIDVPIANENTSYVWINQAEAQYEVAKKTMELDTIPYTRILYIAGKDNGHVTPERLKGIQKFAKDYKMKLNIQKGYFSEKKAREITMEYGEKVDMIVCASDLMAIGAMRACMEMDIFRPVCGFDGITLMAYAGKQMNTVKQNFAHIAEEAVAEMNNLMSGKTGHGIVLDYEIVRMEYKDIVK
ncbi:MAG: LacI family DNA-binding transcriptional regulator [Lachnospiraceae bacterium]|nr:LacI family DNA-binding transcriptional regulator [Lachnospiraceae bacterium]